MIKKILKWLGVLFLLLLLVVGSWTYMNWRHVERFPSIISSFYAKMMCSCLYVQKHDKKYCHNYARQYVPIQKVKVFDEQKIVEVTGLWRTNRAKYVSKRFGCTLQETSPTTKGGQ